MKVCLSGPDDLGYWFLEDEDGSSFELVTTEAELVPAAALFGYKGNDVNEAREWLEDFIGEKIDAPADAEAYFNDLYEED